MLSKKPKKISVDKNSTCDFCDSKVAFLGGNKEIMKVHRACVNHKAEVQEAIKKEKQDYENNQA